MANYNRPGIVTENQKNVVLAWWKKVTAANPKAENFQRLRVPVVEKGVFGIPLGESIKYAYSTISYMDDETNEQCYGVIPTIVAKCGSFLKEEGLFVDGIFRLSGSAKRIGMLQTFFDTPPHYGSQLDWRGYTVHDAANIMRRFLNYLPDPVIPHQYYHEFRELIDDQSLPDELALIEAFQKMIERLPLPNQFLLLYILDMLSLFALNSKSHRMDASNLAAVFAPGILSHPCDQMIPAQYKRSQRVLEFLINHQGNLTMPPACVLENKFIPNQAATTRHLFTPTTTTPTPPIASPTASTTTSAKQEQGSLPLSPIETLNALVGPWPSSIPHKDKRPSSIAAPTPTKPERVATMYEPSDLASMDSTGASIRPSSLKRSQTLPSKQQKYGENEPTQVVHVGRNSSQASRRTGWKHIKRVSSERRLSDAPLSDPLSPSSPSPPLPNEPLAEQQSDSITVADATTFVPPASPAPKFLWDVSLDEEDEDEPKPINTSTVPSLHTQSHTSQESLARTSVENSSPEAIVPSSPRSANGFKGLYQKVGRKDSADDEAEHAENKPMRMPASTFDTAVPGNGGFKAAMRRGTIGKLFAKSSSRRSSNDEADLNEDSESRNSTSGP